MPLLFVFMVLIGHWASDFLCQSDWMALNKSRRVDALALHVGVYTAVLMPFVLIGAWQAGYATAATVWLWLGLNAVAHFVQDALTSNWTSQLWFIKLLERPQEDLRPVDGLGFKYYGAYTHFAYITPTRHWFFVVIGLDQLLHYLTLFGTARLMGIA